jgi:hypothetical protein
MRWTWLGVLVVLDIIGGACLLSAPASALGRGAPVTEVSSAYAVQPQQPSPTDAPTGVTPAPTGTATPTESSPPAPDGPGNTGTAQQQSDGGITPLLIAGILLLVVLLVALYMSRRGGRARDQ